MSSGEASAALSRWASARDRDHMLQGFVYLYATLLCAHALACLLLSSSPGAALAWAPVRVLPSFFAFALVLANHRRVAIGVLPATCELDEPPSSWFAIRSTLARELHGRAKMAPAALIAASVAASDAIRLGTEAARSGGRPWIYACAGAEAELLCYAPEPLIATAGVLLSAGAALCAYAPLSDQSLSFPQLQQDAFLRLRPLAPGAALGALKLCARTHLALLALVSLAPVRTLTPFMRLLHCVTLALRGRAAALQLGAAPGAEGARAAVLVAGWAHWLQVLVAAALFALGWRACILLAGVLYTRRAPLTRAAVGVAPSAPLPLAAALAREQPALTQHLALLDLCCLARLDAHRRAELFADHTGTLLRAALDGCSRHVRALTAALVAVDRHCAQPPSAPPGVSPALWQRLQHGVAVALWREALGGAQLCIWAARAAALLVAASREEDSYGLVQTSRSVENVLSGLLAGIGALESPALAGLTQLPHGVPRGGAAHASSTPQHRRLVLGPLRQVRAAWRARRGARRGATGRCATPEPSPPAAPSAPRAHAHSGRRAWSASRARTRG